MFISKTTFPTFTHRTLRTLSDAQRLHEVIAKASPHDGAVGRTLWRLDSTSRGMVLYVVAPSPVDEVTLRDNLGGRTQVRPYVIPDDVVAKGSMVKFKLKANPAINTTVNGVTKRKALTSRKDRVSWLERVASNNGFTFNHTDVEVRDAEEGRVIMNRRENKGGKHALHCAEFSGVVTVTDTEKFLAALYNGVGKARAFGCGLITLTR